MAKWQYSKGLHDIGNGLYAYLLPDGSLGWSNAGLIVDGEECLLVDTLFTVPLTQEMLDVMRDAEPAAKRIGKVVNTHANADHVWAISWSRTPRLSRRPGAPRSSTTSSRKP